MSASSLASQPFASSWIISKREDLIWFIGGSAVGYVALGLLMAGFDVMSAYLIWNLLIDGPHVFSTVTRTYFDKTARKRLGWKLWSIIPFMMLGPTIYYFGGLWWFTAVIISWAQYHIAKQHFGFLMLYKRKTGERSDFKLDRYFVIASLMIPWFAFVLSRMGVSTKTLLAASAATYGPFLVFYLHHQFMKSERGEIMNKPKLLLLAVVVPLQWIAFFYAMGKPEGIVIAGIATNIGHSLQYQRLTWFHNRNRYRGETSKTVGLAALINSRVVFFFLTAAALNFGLYLLPRISLNLGQGLLVALFGINLAHYFIDSYIWRTREDAELARALNL